MIGDMGQKQPPPAPTSMTNVEQVAELARL